MAFRSLYFAALYLGLCSGAHAHTAPPAGNPTIDFTPSLGTKDNAWHVWGNAFLNAFTDRLGRSYLYHQLKGESFVGGSNSDTASFSVYALAEAGGLSGKAVVVRQPTQTSQTLRAIDGASTDLDVSGIRVTLDNKLSSLRATAIQSHVTVGASGNARAAASEGVFVVVHMQSLAPTPLSTYTETLLDAYARFHPNISLAGDTVTCSWSLKASETYANELAQVQTQANLKRSKFPGAPLSVYMSVDGEGCKQGLREDGDVQIFVGKDIPQPLFQALPSQYSTPVAVFLPTGSSCAIELGVLADDVIQNVSHVEELDRSTFAWATQPLPFPVPAQTPLSGDWIAALQKEADWKLKQLSSWSTYRASLGTFAVPQGSSYEYALDEFDPNTGDMLRDTGVIPALAAGGLKHLARSSLENTMRIQNNALKGKDAGEIPYSWAGENASSVPFGVHPDLDVHLFGATYHLLANEVVDCQWLTDSHIGFMGGGLPAAANGSDSAMAHLRVAFSHFKNRVSRGPHGIVRAFSGDWSDNLQTNQPDGYDSFRSETVMVSALAIVVFRQFSTALLKACPSVVEATDLANDLLAYRKELQTPLVDRSARAAAWTTSGPVPHYRRAYLYKMFSLTPLDLGNEFVDLNAQLWPLLSDEEDGLLSSSERVALLDYIRTTMDEPNALGVSILAPGTTYPGMGELGQFMQLHTWARPLGLLLRAYVHNNKTDWAWDLLARSSSTNHCQLFPDTALGCTSGPDALNEAGGAWDIAMTQDMTKFPWANANPNAMWLWGLMALNDASKDQYASVAKLDQAVFV